jgi:Ca2+-transporting ATPase
MTAPLESDAFMIGRVELLRRPSALFVRARISAIFRDAGMARRLEAELLQRQEVVSARASARTGNVLLELRAPADEAPLERLLRQAAFRAQSAGLGAIVSEAENVASEAGEIHPSWHVMPAAEAARQVDVDLARGLSAAEAARRLLGDGPNRLPEPELPGWGALLAAQIVTLPVFLLLGSAGLSLVARQLADAAVTVGVVAANAIIGFVNEAGAARTIAALTQAQGHDVRIRRDGAEVVGSSLDVVRGDVLLLRPGEVLAADGRITAADELTVNEALLSGESAPVEKTAETLGALRLPLADRKNMGYRGTFVSSGSGELLVTATGAATEIGRITQLAEGVDERRTPMERDLDRLARDLALLAVGVSGAVFGLGLLRGRPAFAMLKSAVALAVAALPEGLPVVATTTLALGLRKLRRQGVRVRRLRTVEALGGLQALCLDKTGTLTQNRMRLDSALLPDGLRRLDEMGSTPPEPQLRLLLETASLCSENGPGHPNGSGTETAIFERAAELGLDVGRLRERLPIIAKSLRRPGRRWMRTIHRHEVRSLVAVKGDPLQLLQFCARRLTPRGGRAAFTDEARREVIAQVDAMASEGLRVLGVARGRLSDGGDVETAELTWLGAIGLKDPLRAGAKTLIRSLRAAGVRPIMITGDHGATAAAIAREIGLSGPEPLRVVDASELGAIPPALRRSLVESAHVFARAAPHEKLAIVRDLQASGRVVGMTGDGFNDAPSLKAADVAIAVGRDSASAARDLADAIVDVDDLSVLADAIAAGRTIASNVRKSAHFLIASNFSEILLVAAETFGSEAASESPLELLWLNLVTDVLPGLGLAMEPPEPDVMRQPSRPSDEPILRRSDLRHAGVEGAVLSAGALAARFYALRRYGPGPQARGVTFTSLVAGQLLYALSCRSDRFRPLGGRGLFGNAALDGALLGSAALQVLPFLIPPLGRAMGVALPSPGGLAVALGTAGASFLINEGLLAVRGRAGAISSTLKANAAARESADA